MEDKPPYKVPSMDEIEALPWNGFNVVSTFSGAGGSCLGYRMAGFRVLFASEFVPAAQEVYKLNHPGSHLDTRDIRNLSTEDILGCVGLARGELDLLDGSPPCASFSSSGKREEDWGEVKAYSDTKQRTDDLFHEYIRLIDGLQPKVFVAENVAGLVQGKAKGYFIEILEAMKATGYHVQAAILDAQWLGVPQTRRRLIFIGVRDDLGIAPVYPKPFLFRYTLADAVPWVREFVYDTRGNWRRQECAAKQQPVPCITVGNRFHLRVTGESLPSSSRESKQWEGMGYQGGAGPSRMRPRPFAIGELRRICGFPGDFQLTGSQTRQWERLGRAVPPLMMRAVAATVRDKILGRIGR